MSTPAGLRALTASLLAFLPLAASCASVPADARPRASRSLEAYSLRSAAAPALPRRQADEAAEPRGLEPLERFIAHALAQSPDLLAAREAWLASEERGGHVSALPNPRFSYGEFLEEVQTRTGPQERRFGLSQRFPTPGERGARRRVAERGAEVGAGALATTRAAVRRDVSLAYYEHAHLAVDRGLLVRQLELLRALEPVVRGRVRTGAGQEDLLRLQVELGKLEDALSSAEHRERATAARLARAAYLEPAELELLPVSLRLPSARELDPGRLAARLRDESPELLTRRGELSRSRAEEELASYRAWPEFTLMLDYIVVGDAQNPGTAGSGRDPVAVGVALDLPLWTSSNAAYEREARHRARAARRRLDASEAELEARLAEEVFAAEDAGRRVTLYRDSLLPRAREAFELARAAYTTSSASLLDLFDAERTWLELERSMWRAARDHHKAMARLEGLVGGAVR